MNTDRMAMVLPAVLIAVASVLLGFHPVVLVGLVVGVFVPDIDTVDVRTHRSWFFHTFFSSTILYVFVNSIGQSSALVVSVIHFMTIGTGIHLTADFVYPKTQRHPGAEWPVRPAIWSAPWGILWLGIAWTIQWFLYLSSAFLPWLAGAGS